LVGGIDIASHVKGPRRHFVKPQELSGMRMERASDGQMANVAKHRERRLRELRQVFHGCWALKVQAWTSKPGPPGPPGSRTLARQQTGP